jgi:hypothetical protein
VSALFHVVSLGDCGKLGCLAAKLASIAQHHLRPAIGFANRAMHLHGFAHQGANVSHIAQIVSGDGDGEGTLRLVSAEAEVLCAVGALDNFQDFGADAGRAADFGARQLRRNASSMGVSTDHSQQKNRDDESPNAYYSSSGARRALFTSAHLKNH